MYSLNSDLRAVMKPVTKYTNNTGGSNAVNEYDVTPIIDYCFLLSEFKVFGVRTYANPYEQFYQKQYRYFITGNPKTKNKYDTNIEAPSVSSKANWWLRPPNDLSNWCYVTTDGSAARSGTHYSYGIAPAFVV